MDGEITKALFCVYWQFECGEWEQEDMDTYKATDEEEAVDLWWVDETIPAGAQVVKVERMERHC